MPVSKLKNLVLLILLLSNLILLSLLVPRQIKQKQEVQQLRDTLSELCEKQNVTLASDKIPETIPLYPLELANAAHAELHALQSFAGDDIAYTDGTIKGDCVQQTGHWENGTIRLKLQNQKAVSSLQRSAKKTLDAMSFQYHSLTQPERLSPGMYTLRAKQTILGVPLFSQGLTLTYSNSCLSEVSGEFFAGTLTKTDSHTCISVSDAVVSFLSARVDLGWVGSSITALEQGYLPSVSGGIVRLTPVWKLTTDTGSFYVHGITSEVIATDNSSM